MFDDRGQTGQPVNNDAFSWWSWRPGIRPHRALLLGIPLLFIGLCFTLAGIYALISIILDNASPPTRIQGVVTGYASGILDSLPHLSISLQQHGRRTVAPAVTPAEQRAIHSGDIVILDYSPHFGYLYAVEDAGQHYALPGGNPLGSLFPSIALILVGLLFFPYPFLLASWGWRDLRQSKVTIHGKVLSRRASQRTRVPLGKRAAQHPGLTPRIGRAWYGVALTMLDTASQQDIVTFAIREERYNALREGQFVEVHYSPHLRYVYSISPVADDLRRTGEEQEQAR